MGEERKQPEEYSLLALYGDRETFQGMLDKGFAQVIFGSGEREVDGVRIIAVWAFTHPGNGRVAIYGTRKSYDFVSSMRGRFEQEFPAHEDFAEFCSKHGISQKSDPISLEELLSEWAK